MSTYVVSVTLRHKDSKRQLATWVSVEAPFDQPDTARLLAAQMCTTHRLGWMPTSTTIIEMEA